MRSPNLAYSPLAGNWVSQASVWRFMVCVFMKHLQSPVSISTHSVHTPLAPSQCIPLAYPGEQFIIPEGLRIQAHRLYHGEGKFIWGRELGHPCRTMSTPRGAHYLFTSPPPPPSSYLQVTGDSWGFKGRRAAMTNCFCWNPLGPSSDNRSF